MQRDAAPRLAQGVIFKNVGDELVLLDYDRGVYYGLDEVGARIWQLISSGSTLGAVVDTLLEEYEVDRETLEVDVDRLIGELTEKGLLSGD